jgi:hypothetical protein
MRTKLIKIGTLFCFVSFPISIQASEEFNCIIEFENNSSVNFINQNNLDECFEKLNNKDITAATIISSASLTGTKNHNFILSKETPTTLERIVKLKYPDILIKKISMGENKDLGRKNEIVFIIKDESDKKRISELTQSLEDIKLKNQQDQLNKDLNEKQRLASIDDEIEQNKKNEKKNAFFNENPNFRVAIRTGMDTVVDGRYLNYLSGGAEFAWINRNTFIRPEVGVKFISSISGIKINDQEVTNVMNAYVFVGGGIGIKGFVTGARLLLGNEWIDINNKTEKINDFALGGEARIGYEWEKGISLFASYALTKRIQMIGADIGYSF